MYKAGASRNASDRVQPTTPSDHSLNLLCFSHLRWGFVYQRPQHLLTRAARDYNVFFFEEPRYEAIRSARLDLTQEPGGVTVAVPILPHGLTEAAVEAAQRRLLDQFLAERGSRRNIFWYYTPMAMGFTDHVEPELCIYDCMDELSAFRFAPPKLKDRERALLRRADLVFTGGQSLYEAKKGQHAHLYAFPSSIDAAHFARARKLAGAEPADQSTIPHPRLGYFGVIDERMNLDLLRRMSQLRPEWQFVMIGPVVKIEEASLPRAANIHWLGSKRYDELPGYLAGWDVGLMPFALNESTRFISPTKTPEFLAAGVPVVSTAIVDVVRTYGAAGLVEIAADPDTMVLKAESLLARPKQAWLERVDRHLAGFSWDRTWDSMQTLMREQLAYAGRSKTTPAIATREAAHV